MKERSTNGSSVFGFTYEELKKLTDRLISGIQKTFQQFVAQNDIIPDPGRIDLANGFTGNVLLYSYLDRIYPDEGWDKEAHVCLTYTINNLNSMAGLNAGLFTGLSGIAFVVNTLSKSGTRYQKLIKSLDEQIFSQIDSMLSGYFENSEFIASRHYDVISGISGIGTYLMERADTSEEHRHYLSKIIKALIQKCSSGILSFRTPSEDLPPEQDQNYPDGLVNFGLAHGIPGILAFLSLAKIEGFNEDGLDESIMMLAECIMNTSDEENGVINWPYFIPLDKIREDREETLDNIEMKEPHKPFRTRTAWCFGTPGIARSLYLAGKAVSNEVYRDFAHKSILSILKLDDMNMNITTPIVCHGQSGLLEIMKEFWKESPVEDLKNEIHETIRKLLIKFDSSKLLGYPDFGPLGQDPFDAGLLNGASGLALVLLGFLHETSMAWNRAFLIS